MEKKEDLRGIRVEKLAKLQEMNINPYPYKFNRKDFAQEIHDNVEKWASEERKVCIAGRIMAQRRKGKVNFIDLMDSSGRIQVYIKKDNVGEEKYEMVKILDIGDIIGVEGRVFQTRTGEDTIFTDKVELLSKSILPLPIVKEKVEGDKVVRFDEFADKELRYRRRYVDLIVNPDVRETFIVRSKIVSAMRRFLEDQGYLEVETPILQPIYGGAMARPFMTHHNALNMDLYLRIADELYLKRLIVGGYDGVFEFCKDFRNEGIDRMHNPEFSMMELYVAYHDYIWMMELVENMYSHIVKAVHGKYTVEFQGKELNFEPPWTRLTMNEAIFKYVGIDVDKMSIEELKNWATEKEMGIEDFWGKGKIISEIYDGFAEEKIWHPTFIMDHPVEISPLAKKHRSIPDATERFEVFCAGFELGNAFSELNDPIDQRERFEGQTEMREKGDAEAHVIDEDYLMALEYGMPPTAGLGVGIDRLVMLLTNSPSIRDVLLFPQMKPESKDES